MFNFWNPQPRTRDITYNSPRVINKGLVVDMCKQTHLLIAGETGSGKSVVINNMMGYLASRFPMESIEDGVKLILIDPKRVELCQYRNLPHTLRYASEPEQIYQALLYAEQTMEARYKQMQSQGKRMWDMGHIYVIIDEAADLMTTDKKRVTPVLQRLLQLGRASGIHVVLATQRPTSEILKCALTCNISSRLALHCARPQDSRNIIDVSGAENLPRYGYGMYKTPEHGVSKVQIPKYKQSKLDAVIDHWTFTYNHGAEIGLEDNDIGDMTIGFRGEP